jgi:glycosyltransferase involved in cell wall biosynthesis
VEGRPPSSVVCVTPVRNEAWILPRFLECASAWADHIVIADQGSTDGSREIARRFPKVHLIENSDDDYNEGARQRLLLEAARRIAGRRLIIALDADEALSADVLSSPEWQAALEAEDGTVIRFDWVNLLPGLQSCWIPPEPLALGLVDDGSEHHGERIHSTRVPAPDGAPDVVMRDVKALHYQHASPRRMRSKQRWYQCWERVNHPRKRPIQLYRQYHQMDGVPRSWSRPVEPGWLAGYEDRGIDMRAVLDGEAHWYDGEVLDWMAEHGVSAFRRLDIWDVDWLELARLTGRELPPEASRDPRSRFERAVHAWLQRTQRTRAGSRHVRLMQRLLVPLGW